MMLLYFCILAWNPFVSVYDFTADTMAVPNKFNKNTDEAVKILSNIERKVKHVSIALIAALGAATVASGSYIYLNYRRAKYIKKAEDKLEAPRSGSKMPTTVQFGGRLNTALPSDYKMAQKVNIPNSLKHNDPVASIQSLENSKNTNNK